MIDYTRDDVIEALEYLLSPVCTETQFDYCDEIRAAIAFLKEQEPRVMTWDELKRCADGDPAFIEARDWSGCWMLIYPTYMGMNDKDGYGVRWRYWTSRPTPEQMRDTKWEKMP